MLGIFYRLFMRDPSGVEDIVGCEVDFNQLAWQTPDERRASVEHLYEYVTCRSLNSMGWYSAKKPAKKRMAQLLRVTAILATVAAGILPILAQMSPGGIHIAPGWASVAVAVGVGAVGMDRYFGYSSAWMRFLLARNKLEARLMAFRFEWEVDEIGHIEEPWTIERTQKLVQRCADFAAEIQAMVDEETQVWVEEFKSAMQKVEESLQIQAEVDHAAALNITVTNADDLEEGWKLLIDGQNQGTFKKKSGSVTDVVPGMRNIRVLGTYQHTGEDVEYCRAINIEGGEILELELTLE